jgi:two-component system, LytTR family, sensor kinase
MELAKLVILVQCSALGAAVSLLLIALLLRQKNADAGARIGVALGVCVFGMYAIICEVTICIYYALPIRAWIIHLLLCILAFLPALIVWSWRKSPVLRWESKTSTWLVAAAFVSGCAIVVISHWFGPQPNKNQNFERILAMHRALCLAPAIISILRLPLDARLKTFMKATSLAYLAASSINAIRIPGLNDTSLSGDLLILIAQTCALCGVIGSFIVAARFRLVDVFLRWSTRITILGVFSLVGSLSFVFFGINSNASNRSVGLLVCSVGLVLISLLGMALTERCERWVESHVLQRLDLGEEATRLQNELFSIEGRENLFSFIETELTGRLEVREVRVVPRSSVPPNLLALESAANAPLEINSYDTPLQIGPLRDVDVLVPIPSTEDMIGVSTGIGRQSLNSGEIGFLKDLGHGLGLRLNHLEVEAAQRQLAMRETLLRQQLTEAELRALRAQVNPHFLFNSLNTIADLIVRDPVKAERMTLRLSSVFRHVLTQSDRQFITLQEEFEFLYNYLDIEQERFGDNLQVRLTINPRLDDVRIPTLLLQPLVENALKHGLAPKGGRRNLWVTASVSEGKILLEVTDDGVGFTMGGPPSRSSRAGSGVGLANTRARLHSVYGREGTLEINSTPMNGCRVSVSIPWRK